MNKILTLGCIILFTSACVTPLVSMGATGAPLVDHSELCKNSNGNGYWVDPDTQIDDLELDWEVMGE